METYASNFDKSVETLYKMMGSTKEALEKAEKEHSANVEEIRATYKFIEYSVRAFEQHEVDENMISQGTGTNFNCMTRKNGETVSLASVYAKLDADKMIIFCESQEEERVADAAFGQIKIYSEMTDGDHNSVKIYDHNQRRIDKTEYTQDGAIVEAPTQVQ